MQTLCNNLILGHFHHSKKPSTAISSHSHSRPSPQPLNTTNLLSVSISLPDLDTKISEILSSLGLGWRREPQPGFCLNPLSSREVIRVNGFYNGDLSPQTSPAPLGKPGSMWGVGRSLHPHTRLEHDGLPGETPATQSSHSSLQHFQWLPCPVYRPGIQKKQAQPRPWPQGVFVTC